MIRLRGLIFGFCIIGLCALSLSALREPAASPAVPAISADREMTPRHDIYNSARTAMVNAHKELAESLELEREIVDRIGRARQKIDASVALLASAGRYDPAVRPPIDRLQSQLATVLNSSSLCPGDTPSCLDRYRQMLDDLQTLIEQY